MDNPLIGVGPLAPAPGVKPSRIEEAAHSISEEWKRGEDIVGPVPVVVMRLLPGVLTGASDTKTLRLEAQPDAWIIRFMPQSALQLVNVDLGNGDKPIIPVVPGMPRLVLPAYRNAITITNDASLNSNVYYIIMGYKGRPVTAYDWL